MEAPHLFVYYRVAEADLAALLSAAKAMQTGLALECPLLQPALYRRPDLRDGEVTVMECYAQADEAAQAAIDRAAEALAHWLRGPRHVERFDRL